MPPRVWNDINLPGFSRSKEVEKEHSPVTGIEDTTPDEEPEDEVRIVSAEWIPGAKGFQYNEQCYVDVTAEYLVETNRAQIKGNLFGIYDGVEVDMGLTVSGYIDDTTMIARISIPKLYFVNNNHYATWQEDKSVPCQYVLKGINHTLGANTIDSPVLDMPNGETAETKTLSIKLKINPDDPDSQNFKFTLYSTDDERSYEQVKSVRDDALQNNNTTELLFTDLDENLTYTLEQDAGNGNPPKIILRNRAYGKWVGAADGFEKDTKSSGANKGGLFKRSVGLKDKLSNTASTVKSTANDQIGNAKALKNRAEETVNGIKSQVGNIIQAATQTVNNARSQADDIKQNATQTINDAKSQVDDIKQNATQTVNDAKSQVDDIKQSATQTVNDARSQVEDIKQNATQTVNDAKSQADNIKQNAAQTVNDAKSQVDDIKQNAAQTVNDAKSQVDDIKQDATQTVNDAKSQVDDIRQNATQTVNDAKSQVNDIKQNATQTVNDAKSQVDDIRQSASRTV